MPFARATALLLCAGFAACSNPRPAATPAPSVSPRAARSAAARSAPAPAPSGTPSLPPIVVKGNKHGNRLVEISEYSHGRIVYHLFADSVYTDTRTRQGAFQKTHGLFFEKDGKTLSIDAPLALVDQNSKSVRMTGGVRATTTDGAVLTCDELVYNDVTQMMHGTGNVKLTRAGQILTGEVIDADLHLEQYRVTGS